MISAHPPLIYHHSSGGQPSMQVATQFTNGNKTVSLSCDNSVGRLKTLSRSDIRCFMMDPQTEEERDVTAEVLGAGLNDVVRADIENMSRAMNWLRQTPWGFYR